MFASGSSLLTLTLASLLASSAVASPLPVKRAAQIVFNPTITTPRKDDLWTNGATATVTWETDNIPASFQAANSTLYLGYQPKNQKSGNEHLKWTLADQFPLKDGIVSFSVPTVPPRDDYIVVLLGDSGNKSPTFSIQQAPDHIDPAPVEPSATIAVASLTPASSATSTASSA